MIPIVQPLTGLVFLLTAEAGIIISNFSRNVEREWNYIYDHSVGYDTGFAAFNPTAKYTISGKTSALTGTAAAAPGTALTVANYSSGNGITAGTVVTETASISHAEKGFREISVSAWQKPGIVLA